MKQLHIVLISIFTGLLVSFGLLSTVSGKASAVSGTAGDLASYVAPGGNCGGMTPCYASIQAAVNAASPDALIKVAAGTYSDIHAYSTPTGHLASSSGGSLSQVLYLTKTLTIQGGYIPADWVTANPQLHPTVLDGGDLVRVVLILGDASPTLYGLQITRGNATGMWGDGGGGILISSSGTVTVQGCRIIGNRVDEEVDVGGGIGLDRGTLIAISNEIVSNTVSTHGGGIGVFDDRNRVFLKDNLIAYNRAAPSVAVVSFGGGVFLNSSAVLEGNIIRDNFSLTEGGGIWHSGELTLTNNLVFSNTSKRGGGFYSIFGTTQSQNNVFAHNHSSIWADGVFIRGTFNSYHDTFVANDEVGLGVMDYPRRYDNVYLTNTIVASQTIGIGGFDGFDNLAINGILWHNTPITVSVSPTGTYTIQNQYYGDPHFTADGYHLQFDSAAIDRGVFTSVATDIDGEPRRMGKAPDLGADERRVNTIDSRLKLVSLDFSGNQGTLVFDFQSHNLWDASVRIWGIQNAAQLSPELRDQVINVTFSQALFTAPDYLCTQDYRSSDGRVRYIYTHEGNTVALDHTWRTVLRVTVQFYTTSATGSLFNWMGLPTYFIVDDSNDVITGLREAVPPELQNFPLQPPKIDTRLKFADLSFASGQGWLALDVELRSQDGSAQEMHSFQDAFQLSPALAGQVIDVQFSNQAFAGYQTAVEAYNGSLAQVSYIYSQPGLTPVVISGAEWQPVLRVVLHFTQADAHGALSWYPDPTPPVYQALIKASETPYYADATGLEEALPAEMLDFSMGESVAYQYTYLPMVTR